jgi:hypothetical protein
MERHGESPITALADVAPSPSIHRSECDPLWSDRPTMITALDLTMD